MVQRYDLLHRDTSSAPAGTDLSKKYGAPIPFEGMIMNSFIFFIDLSPCKKAKT